MEILNYFLNMSWIEMTATVFGIICVYYCVKNHVLAWPTGVVTVIAWGYLFFNEWKLYSDAMLQIFYFFPIQFYGWWLWAQKTEKMSFWKKWFWNSYTEKSIVKITLLSNLERVVWSTLIVILSVSWGWIMATYTDANLPYIDALTVGMSIVAQYLMGKRVLENWILWIGMDIIALYKYSAVGAYGATFLYVIFTVLATMGLIEWIRERNNEQH